ncbi:MAG: T9SS type A sorting domain-containing protein, partial [Bacteroidales bacterium]|nr:T9SS type A sorting domain-containing protein [Bacteroidales bacterium]
YPNPVTNILNIEAQGIQEVSVMDVNGRTVMTLQNTNRIDMSNLANGVYFVRVITAEGVSIQKIAKK